MGNETGRGSSRRSLATTYKSLIRPRLVFGDMAHHQASTNCSTKDFTLFNIALLLQLLGQLGGTSSEKLFQELGLGILKSRR